MLGLPPLTPTQAANTVLGNKVSSAISNYESGDYVAATAAAGSHARTVRVPRRQNSCGIT
jgi:hypothetical protein